IAGMRARTWLFTGRDSSSSPAAGGRLLALFWFASLATADETPSFGTDVSVAYGLGALLGSWPDAGVHGFFQGRFDAFTANRDQTGPRLGASIWASVVVAPQQYAREEGENPFK